MNKLTDLFRGTGGRGMAIGLALLSLQLIAIVFAPWICLLYTSDAADDYSV